MSPTTVAPAASAPRPVGPAPTPVGQASQTSPVASAAPQTSPAGPAQNGASQSPATASTSSEAPQGGTEGEAKKRGRRKLSESPLAAHPLLNVNAEGKATTQLDAVPADYDPKIHRPLARSEFKSESVFLRHRAEELKKKAAEYEEEAKQLELLGTGENQKQVKKAINYVKQLAELKGTLGAKGIDIDALLAKMKG